MIESRKESLDISPELAAFPYPEGRLRKSCTIFLGYTSNLVSSGLREVSCVFKNMSVY